jgi:uncharacterized protein (TIGR03435 family)
MLAAPCALAQGTTVAVPSAVPATSGAGQQSGVPQKRVETKAPAYEVVSVKPSQPDCSLSFLMKPDGFVTRCNTVWGLLFNAYEVQSLHDHPPGLPAWADSSQFDIEAKNDGDTTAAMQKLSDKEREELNKQMLQALLADRFKLRVHYEMRTQSIYQLVIAKSGARLKEWPAGEKPRGISWGSDRIRVQGAGVDKLSFCLSDAVSRKVVDKTGLNGNYDISLKWTPDDQQATPNAGPTLFTALEEQLGLKLEPAKGPVDTLVVDHVEKPSEN